MNARRPDGRERWADRLAARLDRRAIAGAVALALLGLAFWLLDRLQRDDAVFRTGEIVAMAVYQLATTGATLVALATALVAVDAGTPRRVAYPMAVAVSLSAMFAQAVAFDPLHLFATMKNPLWAALTYVASLGAQLGAPGFFYVYQSNAGQSARAVRRLEAERNAEAERVAQERLRTQLATVDHDLVLLAMRLALVAPPEPATALLATVSAYLRAAQQRETSDVERVVTALRELRRLCASRATTAPREVSA